MQERVHWPGVYGVSLWMVAHVTPQLLAGRRRWQPHGLRGAYAWGPPEPDWQLAVGLRRHEEA